MTVSSSLAAWRVMVARSESSEPVAAPPAGWTAVVPVKDLTVAKSRLPYDDLPRAALALAMAHDVVSVLRATPGIGRVLVITDDPTATDELKDDARIVMDAPRAGLSAALSFGARVAARHWPADGILTVASDLAALSTPDLLLVLETAAAVRASRFLIADAAGSGTTILAAAPGTSLRPRFEGGSRAAHLAEGAVDLTETAPPGLRQDVDTAADVAAILAIGAGPRTLRTLRTYGLA